jgi:phosphoglycerol transferase
LGRQMTRFTNVHDLMGSTIGGLVSTQCGWPVFPSQGFYRDEHFLPGMRCLGDDLERQSYALTFMGGARVSFTRKDTLFGSHGFSKVVGSGTLLQRTPDPTYTNKWGLHDDSLFDLARDEFSALAASGSPFALVLLTVGTHVPGYVAGSCPRHEGSDNLLLQAVHCTDKLVGDFVEYVRASGVSNDTVIAILSDHLMWKGIKSQGLTTPEEQRRMTFLLDRPGEPGKEVDVAGSGLDVPATLDAALGLSSDGRLGLGSSLLSGPGFLWTVESGLDGKDSIYDFVHSQEMRSHIEAYREAE